MTRLPALARKGRQAEQRGAHRADLYLEVIRSVSKTRGFPPRPGESLTRVVEE